MSGARAEQVRLHGFLGPALCAALCACSCGSLVAIAPRTMRLQLWVATCSRKEKVPHYDRKMTYK